MPRNFNPYANSPYDSSAASDAYNVGAYGYLGGATSPSVNNANAQPKQTKAPQTFSDLTDMWAQTLQNYMRPAATNPGAGPAQRGYDPGGTPLIPPAYGPGILPPTEGYGTAPTVAPPPGGGDYLQPLTSPRLETPVTPDPEPEPVTQPDPTTPPPGTPPPPRRHAAPPPSTGSPNPPPGPMPTGGNNTGLSQQAWTTANDWYQRSRTDYGIAYSWLLDQPWIVDRYFQDINMRGDKDVDFVDWLHSQFPEYANPAYKRRGYDTWLQNPDGTAKGGYGYTDANRPPQLSQEDWQKANAAATPLQLGTGYLQQIKDGIANKTIDPKSIPDDQLAKAGFSPEDIVKMKGSTSLSSSISSTQESQSGLPNDGDLLTTMQQLLAPQFSFEQKQLNDQMNQQASVLGDTNAGGYRVENAQANTDLINKQNTRLSDYLATAQQQGLQRALQKYITDEQVKASMYGADQGLAGARAGAGATVSAAGIRANADTQMAQWENALRRYLGDQNYNLGIYNTNAGIYNTDVNDRYRWASLLWMMSPEARLAGGLPFTIPGMVGT